MHALSPILHEISDYKVFLNALYTHSHATTAKLQADALTPVWQALEQSDKKQNKLTAPALHEMFCNIAQYLHVLQLQRPLISHYTPHLSDQLNIVMRKSMPDDMVNSTTITTYGSFGTATLLPNRKYKFTFLTARQGQTLTAIPVIQIDSEILTTTINHQGHELLQTFQALADISNHDYIHAATAPLINAYFSGQNALSLANTPYMRALNRTNMDTHPLRSMYPKNETSWGVARTSTIALAAYDIHAPLEGHPLLAHKALFEQYMDASPTARLVDTYFDQITTLMHRVDAQIAPTIGMYYTNLLYHRMLHMLPHSHPIMQHIETRGAALPITRDTWQSNLQTLTNPHNAKTEARATQLKNLPMRLRQHCKLDKGGDIADQPIQKIIRMFGHSGGIQYWIPLHYAQHKDAHRALPDLHRVLKTTAHDLITAKNVLKAA